MDAAASNQVVAGDPIPAKASEDVSLVATLSTEAVATSSLHNIVINQLLPHQEHQAPWSSAYTVPLYSSFGNQLNAYEGENLALGMRDNFINGEHSSRLILDNPLGFGIYQAGGDKQGATSSALIARPLLDGDSDRSIFSGGNIKVNPQRVNLNYQQRQQNEFSNPFRSYSSVLHQQLPRQNQQSASVFGTGDVQPHDVVSDDGLGLSRPTNKQHNVSITHFQPQQHIPPLSQQARHLSEFISSITQQQCHSDSTAHHYQAQIGALGGTAASVFCSDFLSTNPDLSRNNHYHHLQSHAQNQQRRNVSQRQESAKIFAPGQASTSTSTKRKSKLPLFPNTSSEAGRSSSRSDLYGTSLVYLDGGERFSRKVFVGGLPPDIDEEEIKTSFRRFGSLVVDWPHKAESKSYFPPKGYAFLLFQEEASVQSLIDACLQDDDKLYLCVSSPTIKDKPVQIRPWRLSDSDFVLDSTLALDPRKTVFVGGVPRPLKALELATIMNNLYGNVCYAGIDTDPDLKYPKGAGRVAFSNHPSYIAAISARFVHIHHSEIEKRVEVKPYVLDDQYCDECHGLKCNNKFAPFFCANITCLRYYCDNCWTTVHSQPGREYHKPLVKEGAERARAGPSSGPSNGGGLATRSSGTHSDNSRNHSGKKALVSNNGEPSVGPTTQHQSFKWS